MSADIQFGEVQEAEPNRGLRPDRDAHYCVIPVGDFPGQGHHEDDELDEIPALPDDELKIFIDLDVMRDMEAHAVSDTRVELGGVMLGYQQVDNEGQPFVVITDCLRAEHYKATKGSFKFTHDTWSSITERRAEYHPELEMVGWYHTHPGWSVFLSGMDLFICNNFFNRPLDVALVIDPVEKDRGWFQWTGEDTPVTRRTRGFYLMSNQYRRSELNYFARLYSSHEMSDPRYSEMPFGGSSQPVVNIMDGRRSMQDLAVLGMLTFQFILLSLIAWKLLAPVPVEKAAAVDNTANIKLAAQQEILQNIVSSQGGPAGYVEEVTELKTDQSRMLANMDGQLARVEKVISERERALEIANEKVQEIVALKEANETFSTENLQLKEKLEQEGVADGENKNGKRQWWWIATIGVMSTALAAVSYLFGRRRGTVQAFDELDQVSSSGKETLAEVDQRIEDEKDSAGSAESVNFPGKRKKRR